jgi:hypothetical protein
MYIYIRTKKEGDTCIFGSQNVNYKITKSFHVKENIKNFCEKKVLLIESFKYYSKTIKKDVENGTQIKKSHKSGIFSESASQMEILLAHTSVHSLRHPSRILTGTRN